MAKGVVAGGKGGCESRIKIWATFVYPSNRFGLNGLTDRQMETMTECKRQWVTPQGPALHVQ